MADYIQRLSEKCIAITVPSGANMSKDAIVDCFAQLKTMTGKQKYGLLIDRHNEYSYEPAALYETLNSDPNIVCVAVVAVRNITVELCEIDKILCKSAFDVFYAQDKAIGWIDRQVNLVGV